MGSIIDAIGGLFGHQSQSTNAQKGVSDFQNATNAATANYSPFITGGTNAFNSAQAMLQPGYQFNSSDPSYAWRYQQGLDAANAGASAAGSLNSGGQLKALQQYGQGLASTEFNNQFNRQNTLANYGLQAANGESNALFNGANGTAKYRGNQGDATAAQWGDGANLVTSVGKFFGF
jgi:hypothetical protein